MRRYMIRLAAICLVLTVCILSAYGVTSAWLSVNYDIWSTIELEVGQANVKNFKVFRNTGETSPSYEEITTGTNNAGPYTMATFDNTGLLSSNTSNNYRDLILAVELTNFPGGDVTITLKGTAPTKNGEKLITNIVSVACATQAGTFDDAVLPANLIAFNNSVKGTGEAFTPARTRNAADPTVTLKSERKDTTDTVVLLIMIDYEQAGIDLEFPKLEDFKASNVGESVEYSNNLKSITFESAA